MAEITEVLNPTAMYLADAHTGAETAITAATAQASARYHRRSDQYTYENLEDKSLRFVWPTSAYGSSKTLKSATVAVYVTAKSASGSGNLPAGHFTADVYFANGRALGGFDVMLSDADFEAMQTQQYFTKSVKGLSYEYLGLTTGVTQNAYSNVDYYANASLSVQTHKGANVPRLTAVWTDIVPTVTGLRPSGGAFVDERADNTFAWSFSAVKSYDGTATVQNGGTLKWRIAGQTTEHEIAFAGEATSLIIPAGTIPAGTAGIEWCVSVTTQHGVSAESAWASVSCVDATPDAPSDLTPRSVIVDGAAAIPLTWTHNIASGTAASGAEVQWSTDDSTWTALSGTVTGTTAVAPARAFPAGTVYWRVRTKNSDGVYGPWSESAAMLCRMSPQPPAIERIVAAPRPSVFWQAEGQVGYRVRFGHFYDTGEIYGTDKSAKCPVVLPDGELTVTVSIGNAIGLWSETSVTVQIQNEGAVASTLKALPVREGVRLVWEERKDQRYFVLRDGIPIAKDCGGYYTDKTASGVHRYAVCAMRGDHYANSREVTAESFVRSAMLYDAERDRMLILEKHRGSAAEPTRTMSAGVEYLHFAGRSAPVACDSGQRDETLTLSYTVRHGEMEALRALTGCEVCVKMRDGTAVWAVLDGIRANVWKREDIELSLTRVERSEEVSYD